MDASDVVKRCQNGDMKAFDELFESMGLRALHTACLIVKRRDIAEEAVQEAFIQCYRRIGELRNPQVFYTWFYRILVRICWELFSKDKNNVYLEDLAEGNEKLLVDESGMFVKIEQLEAREAVTQSLEKLSMPLRVTVTLHYFNDLSIKEVARVLHCFEGTVKSRLHKARKILSADLIANGYEVIPCNSGSSRRECEINAKANHI